MKQISQIKLLISCPSDITEEINLIRTSVDELNKTVGKQNSYAIECLEWKVDTYTQAGDDPQSVINLQVDKEYDIVVALFWQRIGTPTKRDISGTVEEVNRALNNRDKQFLIYFKTATPENLNDINIDQLSKVILFKKDLSNRGILYKEFNSTKEFESLFRINLVNLISDHLLHKDSAASTTTSIVNEKYHDISELIKVVEQKDEKDENYELEIGAFEMIERILSSLEIVTSSVSSMTITITHLANRFDERTKELNKYAHIKDDRLRLNKGKIVVDLVAGELDDFNLRISSDLDVFSEHFSTIGPTYSKIMQLATLHDVPGTDHLKQSILDYRNSVEYATKQSAKVLESILEWPGYTSKFNKSKRETEIVLKNVTKEFLQGLRLLDEAIR